MRIALVGREYTIRKIHEMSTPRDNYVEFEDFPCSREEVGELLARIQKDFDGILFTGSHYFKKACRFATASIPWACMTRQTSTILCALMQASLAGYDISRISIDLDDLPAYRLATMLCRSGFSPDDICIYNYVDSNYYQSFLDAFERSDDYALRASSYHLDNLSSGRAAIALTASPSVAAHPSLQGKPVFLVSITEDDLNTALNELRVQHQRRKQQESDGYQAAVMLINAQLADAYDSGIVEYRQMYSSHQIEAAIFSFAQSAGAAVEKLSTARYMLYLSKTELAAATHDFTRFSVAERLQAISDVDCVTIGIGFSAKHSIARSNAQYCSKVADKQRNSCCYMMEEDAPPSGPLVLKSGSGEPDFEELNLSRISQESGVGITILRTIARAQTQYGFKTVTSSQLAEMCGMTVNNVNRVVVKLEAKGYAEYVGILPRNGAGRPKRLIRIKLAASP